MFFISDIIFLTPIPIPAIPSTAKTKGAPNKDMASTPAPTQIAAPIIAAFGCSFINFFIFLISSVKCCTTPEANDFNFSPKLNFPSSLPSVHSLIYLSVLSIVFSIEFDFISSLEFTFLSEFILLSYVLICEILETIYLPYKFPL